MNLVEFPSWPFRIRLIFFSACWALYAGYYFVKNQFRSPPLHWLELAATLPVFLLIAHAVFLLVRCAFIERRMALELMGLFAWYLGLFFLAHRVINSVNAYLPDPLLDGAYITANNPHFVRMAVGALINFSVMALMAFLDYRAAKLAHGWRLVADVKAEAWQQVLEAEKEKQRYEYLALAGEVSPHFFVNMMLGWKARAGSAQQQLGESMERMYGLLLYHLEARKPGKEVVPLQREIDNMLSYLELMDEPTDTTVFLDWVFTGNADGCVIPPTTLICFAGNAVKHGVVSDARYPLRIELDASKGAIRFRCRNRIREVSDQPSHGVGLANVRRRLKICYENNFKLNTYSDNNEYIVELIITS